MGGLYEYFTGFMLTVLHKKINADGGVCLEKSQNLLIYSVVIFPTRGVATVCEHSKLPGGMYLSKLDQIY